MRSGIILAAMVACAGLTPVGAQVTAVVTATTATGLLRPSPTDQGLTTVSGTQISGNIGSAGRLSGSSYQATSMIDPTSIEFANGSASSGEYIYMTTRTTVDVTFRNDGTKAVHPTLHSQIAPAGLGIYIGNCSFPNITTCAAPKRDHTFNSFAPDTRGSTLNALARSSFDFKVLSNGTSIYDLNGSVALNHDSETGKNIIDSYLSSAQSTLSDFSQTSNSSDSIGYAWKATNIDLAFPQGVLLKPGESSTLTYITEVTTESRTVCTTLLNAACPVAYAAFGDPIGRGGGVQPLFARLDTPSTTPTAIKFDSFKFRLPTFSKSGILSYDLAPASGTPEPETWILLVTGFALTGAMLRTRTRRGRITAPA